MFEEFTQPEGALGAQFQRGCMLCYLHCNTLLTMFNGHKEKVLVLSYKRYSISVL